MPSRIVVIVRGKIAYVAPMVGNGVRWAVEPVLAVAAERDALGSAINAALSEASGKRPEPGRTVDLRGFTDPVLRASGLRRQADLDRGAKRFEVTFDGAEARIERWIPDPECRRGRTLDHSWSKSVPSAAVDRIAEIILAVAPTTPSR